MQIKLRSLIAFIAAIAILKEQLFFSIMALLGLEYSGASSSSSYIITVGFSTISISLVYIYTILKKGLTGSDLTIILIFLLSLVIHALWVILDSPYTELFPEYLLFFILLGLPGYLSAYTLIKLNLTYSAIRLFEIFLIIIALGVTIGAVIPSYLGVLTRSLAGVTYQALSYYSAFVFGMLLFYTTQVPRCFRYPWCTNRLYSLFLYALMLSCLLGTVLGGGRGALILILSYIFIYITSTLNFTKKSINSRKYLSNVLSVFSAAFILIAAINLFSDYDFFTSGLERATAFISDDGGVDLEGGSSGRDVVYQKALEYIYQKPLIGYGPFDFRSKTIHPHNLFLEVLLQFGIIGLIFFIIFISFVAYKAFKNWDIQLSWASSLLLYPVVMIMFSGSYLHTAIFIFGVSFILLSKKNIAAGQLKHY